MRKNRRLLLASVLAVALSTVGLQSPVGAGGTNQGVVVSPTPIWKSPRILNGTVLGLAAAGDKIIVGGTFTSARDYNATVAVTRNRILAFDKTTGLIDPSFAPSFDNTVNTLAVSADGLWVYVGGTFNTINGLAGKKLAKLSAANGTPDPAFNPKPNNAVEDMALTGNMLIIGGRFTQLGIVPRQLLAAVDPGNGAVLGTLNIPITVSRDPATAAHIQELDTSPDGHWLAIVGNFIFAGGLRREQMALINLSTQPPSVANWGTTRFTADCASAFPGTYLRDVAFSPDSSYLVTATTGAFRAALLCDSVQRWEVAQTGTSLDPTWVTFTGGDTIWHLLVTDAAVYAGGHQRWMNNPTPSPRGNDDGPGAVVRTGIGALDPLTGVPLTWNPTRDRGKGVEAFLATPEYLYVGSDTKTFAGTSRDRLAVLPTSGGTPNPSPDTISLPVTVYSARSDGNLYRSTFDGTTVTPGAAISGPALDGNDWSSLRDAWLQRGQLYYFGTAGAYYRRSFNGTSFGPVTNLSTSVGYVDDDAALTLYDQPYNVDTTKAVAYRGGRLYYTRTNDTRLFWRWFSLESGIVGAQEYLASTADWSGATGMEIAGNWLYASWNDNKLYRAYVDGPRVDATRTLVDDVAVSGTPWSQVRALAFTPASGAGTEPAPPSPPDPVPCPAGQWKAEYYLGLQLFGAPSTVRCETAVNYSWGTAAPPATGLPANGFSVRWTATQPFSVTGPYQFTVRADDGVILFVDGVPVVTAWVEQLATVTSTATVNLAAGNHEIRLEYFKNVGTSVAQLSYQAV